MADNQQQHKPTTPVSHSGKTRLQPPFSQHRPSLIGMVHVHATPGSPYANLDPASIAAKAADEALLLANTGFDALIIENMHDRPYLHAEELGPETTSLMTRVAIETRKALDKTSPNFPIGIQILSGGSQQAIAVAAIAGLDFIRCENFVFAEIADEGLFARAESAKLLRYRKSINAEHVRIFADIKKKHASHAITADVSLEETAEAAHFFGADALIVTGSATAKPTDPAHVAAAREATPSQSSSVPASHRKHSATLQTRRRPHRRLLVQTPRPLGKRPRRSPLPPTRRGRQKRQFKLLSQLTNPRTYPPPRSMASNTPNPIKSNKDDARPASVPAIMAPPPTRDRPWTRSTAGIIGLATLSIVLLSCILSTPYTFGITRIYTGADESGNPIYQSAGQRFDAQNRLARHIPPTWWPGTNAWGAPTKLHNLDQPPTEDDTAANRYRAAATDLALRQLAKEQRTTIEELTDRGITPTPKQVRAAAPTYILGTDLLGRDLFVRALAGGAISLGIGIAAAILSVIIGTLYGMIAGYAGGRTDAVMMRTVDVLFGLPYVLLVVLLAVAGDAVVGEYISRAKARETWVINQARIQLTEQNAAPATTAQARDHLAENPDLRAEIETPLWNAIRWLEDNARRNQHTTKHSPHRPRTRTLPPPPTNLLADANRLRPRTISASRQQWIDLSVLPVAIAGVSAHHGVSHPRPGPHQSPTIRRGLTRHGAYRSNDILKHLLQTSSAPSSSTQHSQSPKPSSRSHSSPSSASASNHPSQAGATSRPTASTN